MTTAFLGRSQIFLGAFLSRSVICLQTSSQVILRGVFCCYLFATTSGTIPDSLSRLGQLQELWVVPLSKNCSHQRYRVAYIVCWHRYLHRNRISGKIPESMSKLQSLQELDLSNNTLSGEVPQGLATSLKLLWFNVAGNQVIPLAKSEIQWLRSPIILQSMKVNRGLD